MPNYKQTSISGESWQRCYEVSLQNPLNGTGRAVFLEEKVVSIEGQVIKQPVAGCGQDFSPSASFALVDPDTGDQTGTMTHAELYRILYSLYVDTAAKRDADPMHYGPIKIPGI